MTDRSTYYSSHSNLRDAVEGALGDQVSPEEYDALARELWSRGIRDSEQLAEIGAEDMLAMAEGRNLYSTDYHSDGTITIWDVFAQQWVHTNQPSDRVLASLSTDERDAVLRHLETQEGEDNTGREEDDWRNYSELD